MPRPRPRRPGFLDSHLKKSRVASHRLDRTRIAREWGRGWAGSRSSTTATTPRPPRWRPRSHSAAGSGTAARLTWLKPRLRAGDVLLVKGSRGMKLERVVDALVADAKA